MEEKEKEITEEGKPEEDNNGFVFIHDKPSINIQGYQAAMAKKLTFTVSITMEEDCSSPGLVFSEITSIPYRHTTRALGYEYVVKAFEFYQNTSSVDLPIVASGKIITIEEAQKRMEESQANST